MTEKITTTSCECCRHTERTERERKRLMTRLKTMEGQIRGIERLVENDAYCPDIVMQVSAVSCAEQLQQAPSCGPYPRLRRRRYS